MALTRDQVRRRLDVDEPDYPRLARELGAEAREHLRELINDDDELLAAKAASLAGVPPVASPDLLSLAALSPTAHVRLAAAYGLADHPGIETERLLERLIGDEDIGVRKVALRTAGRVRALGTRATIENLERTDPEPGLRRLASATLSTLR